MDSMLFRLLLKNRKICFWIHESGFTFSQKLQPRGSVKVIYLKMWNHGVWTVTSIETKNIKYPAAIYSEPKNDKK